MSQFPQEVRKIYEFINQEFDYSKVTKAGKMVVSFTIDKTGVLNNIRVLQYNDVQSAAEIFRVLTKPQLGSCKTRWKTSKFRDEDSIGI